jgi:maltose O-acetyltransferase
MSSQSIPSTVPPGVQPRPAGVSVGRNPLRRLRRLLGAVRFYVRGARPWLLRGHPASSPLIPLAARRALLRLGGVQLGPGIWGLERCWFDSEHVSIGEGCFLNYGSTFEGHGHITIGRDCLIGPEVMIVTSVHAISPDRQVERASTFLDVRIGDGCWLGARVMILAGVTIGAGTIIGAGAVVTKDCEPGSLYVGVPARKVQPRG